MVQGPPGFGDLANEAGDLIERLAKLTVPGAVNPEVTLSMIELNSSIQTGWASALPDVLPSACAEWARI